MEKLRRSLAVARQAADPQQEIFPILMKCISLFDGYDSQRPPSLLTDILNDVIKALFQKKGGSSYSNQRHSEDSKKLWKEAEPWALDTVKWAVKQYDELDAELKRRTLDFHTPLLVPPLLALLEDECLLHKQLGCKLLQQVCDAIYNCRSDILSNFGLCGVLEASLMPITHLLPSLIPESESLETMACLYPPYRSLIKTSLASTKKSHSSSIRPSKLPAKAHRGERPGQEMFDRVLREGLLAGYVHVSDSSVRIATLLVMELRYVVGMMGEYSAQYLSQILPLIRNILTYPLGASYPPLLSAAILVLRELIRSCGPFVDRIWWAYD